MESAQAALTVNWIIPTTVLEVRIINNHWFVHFDGSRESIAFSHKDEPKPFEPGDNVRITFEKVEHALPHPTPI